MNDITPDYVKPTMTVEEALEVVLNYCKKDVAEKSTFPLAIITLEDHKASLERKRSRDTELVDTQLVDKT
jgi:hypothetical protein|tara:strand:+ start:609 stop:818 length:210 start_codon:yes stop_codon:yes gene_type:complete